MRRRATLGALTVALVSQSPALLAQNRPITIVVGSTAGGSTDTLARVLGKVLGGELGRSVVIDNKPGGNGTISDGLVARSAPDGNTLLMAAMAFTVNPLVFKNLSYDPIADFTPITMVARLPNLLVARRDAPYDTAAELIAYAKAHPDKINFAVAGLGSSIHLATEDFKYRTGIRTLNVPYKGTSAALTDLMGGSVDILFVGSASALPHVKGQKIKVIGVASAEPLAQLPDAPPLSRTIPGFESTAWFGLLGPAKMDSAKTDVLYRAIKKSLTHPDFLAQLDKEAAIRVDYTQQEFARFLQDEIVRLRELADKAKINFDR